MRQAPDIRRTVRSLAELRGISMGCASLSVLIVGTSLAVGAGPVRGSSGADSATSQTWGSVHLNFATVLDRSAATTSASSPSVSSSPSASAPSAAPQFDEAPDEVLHPGDVHPTAHAASGASSSFSASAKASAAAPTPVAAPSPAGRSGAGTLEYLVPELEGRTWSVSEGARRFRGRLSFSPGYGRLGEQKLYAFRLGYNPNEWLGYEASIGHNPGNAVHALFNTLNAVVRYPMPFRFQPYCTVGFGMVMAFPGEALNAESVTKNTYALGAGMEIYVRDDVAIRGEVRRTGVLGARPFEDETVVFSYGEATLGLSFYRTLNQ